MHTEAAKIFSQVILAERPIRIKLLGDSITHGHSGTGYDQNGEVITEGFARNPHGYCWAKLLKDYLENRYACQVVNNGCSGTNTQFILDRLDDLVDAEDDIILCMIGTNDRHQYVSDGPKKTKRERLQTLYGQILTLEEKLRQAGKQVVFMAGIPAEPRCEAEEGTLANGGPYWRQLHMDDIHDLYVKASFERGFPLIDLHTLFRQYCQEQHVVSDDLLKDGLHPNDRGYEVLFRLILKELGFAIPA